MATENVVRRSVFDLDSFEDVTLIKSYTAPTVASVQEALAHLGNDSGKLIEIINAGLDKHAEKAASIEPTGWLQENEEGEPTAFSGTQADNKKVNSLVLTLAKTVFGFEKGMTREQKQAAKQSAGEMIRNTAAIKEGLRKSAAGSEE